MVNLYGWCNHWCTNCHRLIFFRSFKKCYVLDSAVNTSPNISMAPGSSPAHPLLSLALSSTEGNYPNDGTEKDSSMEPTTVSL